MRSGEQFSAFLASYSLSLLVVYHILALSGLSDPYTIHFGGIS